MEETDVEDEMRLVWAESHAGKMTYDYFTVWTLARMALCLSQGTLCVELLKVCRNDCTSDYSCVVAKLTDQSFEVWPAPYKPPPAARKQSSRRLDEHDCQPKKKSKPRGKGGVDVIGPGFRRPDRSVVAQYDLVEGEAEESPDAGDEASSEGGSSGPPSPKASPAPHKSMPPGPLPQSPPPLPPPSSSSSSSSSTSSSSSSSSSDACSDSPASPSADSPKTFKKKGRVAKD
jgi:hypothetical protein